jgi:DNA-binding response OmpR family regulator
MSVQLVSRPDEPALAPLTITAPDPAPLRLATEHEGLYCAGEARILVVDDDPAICQVIQMILSRSRFSVEAVSNPTGMEAQLKSKSYHVLILDYVIPGIDTEQMFHWVQEYQPEASVIVVTAYPSVDSALNCLRAHTFDYLTKPFQNEQLLRVVTRCLENKGLLRLSEEALREALGTVLRERRKALGLTLAQTAQRANVSLGYLSQIELGKNSASIETLYRICLALGIKMAELFQAVRMS